MADDGGGEEGHGVAHVAQAAHHRRGHRQLGQQQHNGQDAGDGARIQEGLPVHAGLSLAQEDDAVGEDEQVEPQVEQRREGHPLRPDDRVDHRVADEAHVAEDGHELVEFPLRFRDAQQRPHQQPQQDEDDVDDHRGDAPLQQLPSGHGGGGEDAGQQHGRTADVGDDEGQIPAGVRREMTPFGQAVTDE